MSNWPFEDFHADQAFLRRLARQLVHDEHEAEDLVQSTWLAALERPPSPGGLRAWLGRVVRNQAINRARGAANRQERERACAREPIARGDLDERLALQEAVLRAVRALPDPVRQTVVLRYSDSLGPREIARKLGLPLGTVKARLGRGLQLLREALDDRTQNNRAGWLLPLAAWSQPPAAVGLAASVPAVTLLLAMKTTIALAVTLACFLFLRSMQSPVPGDVRVGLEQPVPSGGSENIQAPDLAGSIDAVDGKERQSVDAVDAPHPLGEFRIRVIDGRTSTLLAGVQVEVFAKRTVSPRQLKKEEFPFLRQGWHGGIRSSAEWIDLPDELDFKVLARDEPLLVGLRPSPGTPPLERHVSDSQGQLSISRAFANTMLQFSHQGYGTRTMAASSKLETAVTEDGQWVVELWSGGQLEGRLVDVEGRRIEQALDLRFLDSQNGRVIGFQEITTREDGTFDAWLTGRSVYAKCMSPDWRVTDQGIHPVRKMNWAYRTRFEPGNETGPVYIVVDDKLQVTTLHVVDADSGEPIEDFWLLVRDTKREALREVGVFHAPGGLWPLADNTRGMSDYTSQTEGTATVWTSKHLAGTVPFSDLTAGELLEVRLERGTDHAPVHGRVVDNGRPLVGAQVLLSPFVRSLSRHLEDSRRLDQVTTDAEGRFSLSGIPGDFTVLVLHKDEYREQAVSLPTGEEVVIDFAATCVLELTLRDRTGALCVDFPVGLNSDGQQVSERTDENGRVRFVPLDPGDKQVLLAYDSYPGSFSADEVREITLLPRQVLSETWTLPIPAKAIYATLIVDGWEGEFHNWRARAGSGEDRWVTIEPDGTIPVDLARGNLWLYIEGAGHHWKRGVFEIPGENPVVRLSIEGTGYAGVLRSTTGEPFSGVRVFATPNEGAGSTILSASTVTDSAGRFQLVGLEPVTHTLEFHTSAKSHTREVGANTLDAVLFEATAPAADPPVVIDIELPTRKGLRYPALDTVRVHGQVSSAKTGQLVTGAQVDITSLYPQSAGVLKVDCYTWNRADSEARYVDHVPRAPRYRATCFIEGAGGQVTHTEWDAEGAGDEIVRDLTVE